MSAYGPNACPECSQEAAVDTRRQSGEHYVLTYQCPDCGCRWSILYELADEYLILWDGGE
jgi:uncharacterized Zn finger protein